MTNKTKLLFGIHMHQPVDNFEWVIKHGVEVCYGPFFEVMSKYRRYDWNEKTNRIFENLISKHSSPVYSDAKYHIYEL